MKDLDDARRVFTNAWKMLKKYIDIKSGCDDDKWKELVNESDLLSVSGISGSEAVKLLSMRMAETVVIFCETRARERRAEEE